jgi:hypothetical protein
MVCTSVKMVLKINVKHSVTVIGTDMYTYFLYVCGEVKSRFIFICDIKGIGIVHLEYFLLL